MTDPEIHLLSGAYAANALPDGERTAFEEHLRDCPTCAHEVRGLTETTSRLALAVATPAPERLRARVLSEIELVRQRPPSDSPPGLESDHPAQPWYRQSMGIAASFLLVLSVGLAGIAVNAYREADQAEQNAARVAAIATDPDRVTLDQPISTGGTASIVAVEGEAIFRADGLTVLPEDRGYQLWVMNEDGARSVGVLGRGTSSHVESFVEDVGAGDSIGLTVEPSAGSDSPTTDPVLLMTMST